MTIDHFLRRRSAIALLCLLLSMAFPTLAFAQEQATNTEEPILRNLLGQGTAPAATLTPAASAEPTLPENILSADVEWATVTTLRSAFSFGVPLESIAEANLTIEQPGWSESPLVITVDTQDFADASTDEEDFTHLWEVDTDNPPQLFFNTVVTWTFTFEDETTAEVVNSLYYADPRTAWSAVYIRPEELLVLVPSGRYSSANLRAQLQPGVELLESNTGQTPQLNAVLFDASLPLDPCQSNETGASVIFAPESGVEVQCDANAIAAIYEAAGFTLLELNTVDFSAALNVIASQLFNSVYQPLWQTSGSEIPVWFQAGLERYYWPTPKVDLLTISQQALRRRCPS
jgi:hypothetical protein